MTNDLFLRACRRQPVERTPVWMMRQAGRYLPEYRKIRATTDFLTLCKTPELAAEVTVQPVDIVGVDAAIIFSDILVVPEAMGMRLELEESRGPRFPEPLTGLDDVERLRVVDPEKGLRFVMDAIERTRRVLNGRVPLIGFSGAPWTLAAYMVDGSGSKDFHRTKSMMLNEPQTFSVLLDKLTVMVRLYLEAQIAAGADAVQIFDTWGGILNPDHYRKWSLEPIFRIVSGMQRKNVPVIVFSKGAAHSLKEIAEIGADVVGLDWTVDIGEVRKLIGNRVALQGNLDPAILFSSPEVITREVGWILKKYGEGSGHVFNLGHGIAPGVPVDHARAFVRAVKEDSEAYHTND
jgi:uroporphyrinogen decarboxylase